MNETHETARSRRFSCTCGEVWEVDEDWERFNPINPAAECPECGKLGKKVESPHD